MVNKKTLGKIVKGAVFVSAITMTMELGVAAYSLKKMINGLDETTKARKYEIAGFEFEIKGHHNLANRMLRKAQLLEESGEQEYQKGKDVNEFLNKYGPFMRLYNWIEG